MARIDKVAPGVGNFRGTSKSEVAEADWNQIRGVGVDANGLSEIGPSVSGILGVSIFDKTTRRARSRIDIMTVGEIVDLGAGFSPGQKVYVSTTDGTVQAVAGNAAVPVGTKYVGTIMEDGRLVVRFAQS